MGLGQIARASHLDLARPVSRPSGTGPRTRAHLQWEGHIISRAWPSDFDLADYHLMSIGGRRERLAAPDGRTHDGHPHYCLTDAEQRESHRLLDAHCLDRYDAQNIPCDAGRLVLLNFLANASGLTGVTYFAVGTGISPDGQGPESGDTQLWNEVYRQQLSLTTVSGNQVDLNCVFQQTFANYNYTECGIFGNGASTTVNTGSLFAHANYVYSKDNTIVLTNDYFITFY